MYRLLLLCVFFSTVSFAQIPKMVMVEGGTFKMGSTTKAFPDETPQRTVKINSFQISELEIQYTDYVKFCKFAGFPTPSGKEGYSVSSISWEYAVMYCNWLSSISGLEECYEIMRNKDKFDVKCNFENIGYRLPTEAEWEYAARGGKLSKGFIYSGSNSPFYVAWFAENAKGIVHKPSLLQPSEIGTYDMTGNVAEWCWDFYDKNYYVKGVNDNPTGPKFGTDRVFRGGHQRDKIINIENTRRSFRSPSEKDKNIGFRVILPMK